MSVKNEALKDLNKFLEKNISNIDKRFFANLKTTMEDTLTKTVHYDDELSITHIITGDIPAMWNRDSAAQVRPFLLFSKESVAMQKIIKGIINNYKKQIKLDPYANAFTFGDGSKGHIDDLTDMKVGVWERKFEIDSLCYPIQLAYLYWKNSDDCSIFDNEFYEMCETVLKTFSIEQDHSKSKYSFQRISDWLLFENPEKIIYETLPNHGRGNYVKPCGLIWSGFRPSDDACQLHFLIPSNQFAIVILKYMEEIYKTFYGKDTSFIKKLYTEIEQAITQLAIIDYEDTKIFAYEVDGRGNYNLMDDANVPSLLSLPYLAYCENNEKIYQDTRKFILSEVNPFYYKGTVCEGIGSPHTPENFMWHIANGIRGITANDNDEIEKCKQIYISSECGCGMYHEGVNVNNKMDYTRPWFSWSNSVFAEFILKDAGLEVQK